MSSHEDPDAREFPAFEDYLRERDILERVSIAAEKSAISRLLFEEMQNKRISKAEMARKMGTSRAQLDRILDPREQNVTLASMARAAGIVGRRLCFSFV